MRNQAQVVIVGGGVVGAAILYHLAEAGITDVTLIEKDELTSGSTWHAAGNIPTYATSWLGMRAGNYAWQLYKDLEKKTGSPITYRHTGAFWPAHTRERMDLFKHLTGISKSAGFDLSMITPSDMEAAHPHYLAREGETGGVIGGIFDPYEGDIDPSQLTQALAKAARDKGAEIVRFTTVTAIKRLSSGRWKVVTDKGIIECETVINAGGFYGAEVAALTDIPAPVVALEHQYLVTEPLSALESDKDLFPLVRDPDIRFYLRREGNGLLLGSYAHNGRLAWPNGPPPEFAHQLFPDNLDELGELLEETVAHVPLLAEAGVQRCVNGPIAYAPDALPLVGPAAGLPNFYHATGVQIGITHSAAIGKAVAEWLTEGETEWDLSAWDPRRFGDWADLKYAGERACEHYGLQYAIPYPNRVLQHGRPVNQTPLYDHLHKKGAVFGQIGGWERAYWFDQSGEGHTSSSDPYGHLSFYDDEPWRRAVAEECLAVQNGVGVMDHGGFTKFEVEGPGATAYLHKVFCGRLPKTNRVRLSYMLTPKGKLWSEATIARLDENQYLLCGPTLAIDRDFDWLFAHLPDDNTVRLKKGSEFDSCLMVMGPKSRALLEQLTSVKLAPEVQPWMSVNTMEIAGFPVIAMRVSYVGELGWELHAKTKDLASLYSALEVAGESFGLRDFGSWALNCMRIEKGYHGWGSDFGTEYTPFDAGLDRFVSFDKPEFVGRNAVLAQKKKAPEWIFCGFELEGSIADAMPSDPIFLDNELVGYVTSACSGFRIGKRLALGYIRYEGAGSSSEYKIEILGEKCVAKRVAPHFYDPENERLRS